MIPVFKPSVGEEEIESIRKTFESGWIGLGPRTKEFEEKFAEYIGVKRAVALNSATAALDLALKAFKIDSGEVIVPTITFVSTAHAALYNNAKPIFVDVYEDTLCMSIEDLQEKITDKTKAIIPVHLGGHPCDMDPIEEIAEDHDLIVIEDAANATGAEYKGRKVGTLSDAACFSFHAIKNMTTGDGGMITTSHDEIIERLNKLRWVGINRDTWQRSSDPGKYSWYYEVDELGYKYHMTDIQAAIGLVQLKKLNKMNEKRREIVNRYNYAFKDLEGITIPTEKEWAKHVYWLYTIKLDKRDEFIAYMNEKGIATSVHFMPIHLHPLYRKFDAKVPVAERIWKKIVDLPLYPDMTDREIDKVINAVKSFRL